MLVKIGTPVISILDQLGYKDTNMTIVTGGPMMGHSIPNIDTSVTKEMNALLLLPPVDELLETNCMRCGKCIKYCPAGLYPINIKNNINKKDKLKELNPNTCIECGLCSYICPARIPLRDYVVNAKQIVKEDK
jgi:electron transport complex protein RnfC